MCALAKSIGHTDASFHNYKHISSVWNIKRNCEIDVGEQEKKKVKDKNNRSFDDHGKEKGGGSLGEMRSFSDEELDKISLKSAKSVKSDPNESFRVKDIFADQKNLKKMRMQRSHKFSHVVSTLVQDKTTGKY